MGKITDENYRKLKSAENYEDASLSGISDMDFTTSLARIMEEKNVPTMTVVENTSLSKSYINKLRSPFEKQVKPSRYVIIEIALAIDATLEETNDLLKKAKYQELYTRDRSESFIIWGMLKNIPGKEIRRMMQEKGLDDIFREKQR